MDLQHRPTLSLSLPTMALCAMDFVSGSASRCVSRPLRAVSAASAAWWAKSAAVLASVWPGQASGNANPRQRSNPKIHLYGKCRSVSLWVLKNTSLSAFGKGDPPFKGPHQPPFSSHLTEPPPAPPADPVDTHVERRSARLPRPPWRTWPTAARRWRPADVRPVRRGNCRRGNPQGVLVVVERIQEAANGLNKKQQKKKQVNNCEHVDGLDHSDRRCQM